MANKNRMQKPFFFIMNLSVQCYMLRHRAEICIDPCYIEYIFFLWIQWPNLLCSLPHNTINQTYNYYYN